MLIQEEGTQRDVIVGLGKTGLSVARYLAKQNLDFTVLDDNENPPLEAALLALRPGSRIGQISDESLLSASRIILSPGVPLKHAAIQTAMAGGIPVTGDVAIFAQEAEKPLIVITGSNGKSTVTSLVSHILTECGYPSPAGGNIGNPCLELLEESAAFYVIEVSSYQLEVVDVLGADVALLLNLSPDHLDRYEDESEYFEVKWKIYSGCRRAVVNRQLAYASRLENVESVTTFGTDLSEGENDFSLIDTGNGTSILFAGEHLINTRELPLRGTHNALNVMAGLAVGHALGVDIENMLATLKSFRGLNHRCEFVGTFQGVTYINDSKATNIASTRAAVIGLAEEGRLYLILGGQGKGADFTELACVVAGRVAGIFVMGEDQHLIATAVGQVVDVKLVDTLRQAVDEAANVATPGDIVLLSPACASFDMFQNYEDRGNQFKQLVGRIAA